MKIGILTYHQALNYGATCQAYALQKAIKKCGVEAYIVNYSCPFLEQIYDDSIMKKLCSLRGIYMMLLNAPVLRKKNSFTVFWDRYFTLSDPVYNNNWKIEMAKFDKVFVGSDQVWNLGCSGGDKTYFLPGVDDDKKCSYAASLGKSRFSKQEDETFQEYLSTFRNVSVREISGSKYLSRVLERKVSVDVDPVFLLDKDEWRKLAEFKERKSYCLLYLLDQDKRLIAEAKRYAKERKIKVLLINDGLFDMLGVENLRHVTPSQWLGLLCNAEVVFTNSFHGIAFSMILRKKCVPRLLPKTNEVNARIEDLFLLFGLPQIGEFGGDIVDFNKVIDEDFFEKIINKSKENLHKYVGLEE